MTMHPLDNHVPDGIHVGAKGGPNVSIQITFLSILMAVVLLQAKAAAAVEQDFASRVDCKIASSTQANPRWFQNCAVTRPFGMVNLAPETLLTDDDMKFKGGYRDDVNEVLLFSHLHAFCVGGLGVMPVAGDVDPTQGWQGWKSPHDKSKEVMVPGYHKVFLERYGIAAEMTSTKRCGLHQWTFEKGGVGQLLIDLSSVLGEARPMQCSVTQENARTLVGSQIMRGAYTGNYQIFFVCEFDRDIAGLGAWKSNTVFAATKDIAGASPETYGAVVKWGVLQPGAQIRMRVGLSYCSVAEAKNNLSKECTHWDTEKLRADARAEWNAFLGRIEVEGGTPEQRTKFYTDLYHSALGRTINSDMSGAYPNLNSGKHEVMTLPGGEKATFAMHNTDALWWTQWNLNLLWGLAYPDVLEEFGQFLLEFYKTDPKHRLPRGAMGGKFSPIMCGAQATPLLTRLIQMRTSGIDVEKAFEAMEWNQNNDAFPSTPEFDGSGNFEFVDSYLKYGYIPYGAVSAQTKSGRVATGDSVSSTLGHAWCDWVLGQAALTLGKKEKAAVYLKRSENWKNVADPETKYMRPRMPDGTWRTPFDPQRDEYCEGTPTHYTFFVPHDLPGLAAFRGGNDVFCNWLDAGLEGAVASKFNNYFVCYNNQPCLHMAYVFNQLEQPWRSQYWVRKVQEVCFSGATPDTGYNGDEDQGQLGALSALMQMGLFSVQGGCHTNPRYELTAPVFSRVRIKLMAPWHKSGTFEVAPNRGHVSTIDKRLDAAGAVRVK